MPSGPKKRRAARNKLKKLSSPPNLIVSNDEMIPKVTTSVEHESKDDEPQVREVTKEDHHVLMVECDHNVVGAGGSRVEEDDHNGVNGEKPADAHKGYHDGGVSSEVAAAEEEEENAASDMNVTHEMKIPKVADSFPEIRHDHDDDEQVKEAEDDDNAVLRVEGAAVVGVVEDDNNNAVTGNETAHAEDWDAAEDDKGAFGWKKEEWDLGAVKEMLCGGFKDESAFEEYFGKVLAMVDECDAAAAAAKGREQQFKALLLLHKDLIKKGALI